MLYIISECNNNNMRNANYPGFFFSQPRNFAPLQLILKGDLFSGECATYSLEGDADVQDCVHSLEGNDVGVFELAQMFDLSLLDVSDFLHSHLLTMKLAQENSSLRPAAHPLQLGDLLEWHLPGFWKRHSQHRLTRNT